MWVKDETSYFGVCQINKKKKILYTQKTLNVSKVSTLVFQITCENKMSKFGWNNKTEKNYNVWKTKTTNKKLKAVFNFHFFDAWTPLFIFDPC